MTATASSEMVCARIAQRLAENVGSWRYNMWFGRSVKLHYSDQDRRLDIDVPNQFVADRLGRTFRDELCQAASNELGESVDLAFRIDPDSFQDVATTSTFGGTEPVTEPVFSGTSGQDIPRIRRNSRSSGEPAFDGGTATAVMPMPAAATTRDTAARTLRHRLDDFVVGPSNELAYAAAHAMADPDERASSTLFLHGGCGLGKTHLLQGICNQLMEKNRRAAVRYVTGEQFTNEFLAAVRTGKVDPFRRKIRRLDLLAIDDVDFIANKQATQQEFLHCFDAIELSGARVVLASDSHPKMIDKFSAALISRCVRGLVVEIDLPNAETRRRIILGLAARRGMHLLEGTAEALAGRCLGSVREIEGAITKLHALATLNRRQGAGEASVGPAAVQRLFDHSPECRPRRAIRFDAILQAVCDEVGIPREQVLGTGKHRNLVLARSLAGWLARQLTAMSFPEISTALKRGSHSTIISADQRVTRQIAERKSILIPTTGEATTMDELVERLRQRIVRG